MTGTSTTSHTDQIRREESLICEALVREIGQATRWMAVREAWAALLHVRLMANQLCDGPERAQMAGQVMGNGTREGTLS